MESKHKFIIAGGILLIIFIGLVLFGMTLDTPKLTITTNYPSLVFKPSEFHIDFSIKNTVASTLVKNTVSIESGDIIKIDPIPTDCERLTDEERICEESLSFKVNNNTASGTHKIIFNIDSTNYPNLPILKNFLEYAKGHSKLEVPINVQTPKVETLTSQAEMEYNKISIWLLILIFFAISLVFAIIILIFLFWPELWNIIKSLR